MVGPRVERIVTGQVAGTNGGDVLETRYNFESAG